MSFRWKSLLGVSLGAVLAMPVLAQARDFTIASWGGNYQDAQREVYFTPFAKANGDIKVLEETYLGGLAQIKSMVETGNVTWDVLMIERSDLIVGCDEGLLEELDWDAIGGKDQLIPQAVHPCGAGNVVVSTGFAYDPERVKEPPQNYADFWNVEKWPGKRGLRAMPKSTLELALMADGVPLDQVYEVLGTPEGLDRAFAKMDELKPHIQFWEAGAQPVEWLAAGDVVMSTAYNGRIALARKEGRNLTFVWNDNTYSMDSWAIVADSPNKELAMEFIKFANTAEPQIEFPLHIPYGPTNKEAVDKLDPAAAEMLPAGDNMKSALFIDEPFWADNVDRITQRWNAWIAK